MHFIDHDYWWPMEIERENDGDGKTEREMVKERVIRMSDGAINSKLIHTDM